MLLEDFIDKLHRTTTISCAFQLYKNFIQVNFGVDRVIYSFLNEHYLINQKAQHGIFSNYPQEWLLYYKQKNYLTIDPVIKELYRKNIPFLWEDTLKGEQEAILFNEAKEMGLHNGMAVPLHGIYGETAGVGLAFTDKNMNILTKSQQRIIGFITEAFHEYYCSNLANDNQAEILTVKEKEILQWLAIGKTLREIAIIVSLSQDTVKFHLKKIYEKLNVNSKTSAVVKGLRAGLIELDKLSFL